MACGSSCVNPTRGMLVMFSFLSKIKRQHKKFRNEQQESHPFIEVHLRSFELLRIFFSRTLRLKYPGDEFIGMTFKAKLIYLTWPDCIFQRHSNLPLNDWHHRHSSDGTGLNKYSMKFQSGYRCLHLFCDTATIWCNFWPEANYNDHNSFASESKWNIEWKVKRTFSEKFKRSSKTIQLHKVQILKSCWSVFLVVL